MTGNLEYKIMCHFCFEKFEINLEIQKDFTGHNTEIYDSVACCNPYKLSYEIYNGGISFLNVSDGNE